MSNQIQDVETIKTDHLVVSLTRKPGCHFSLEMNVSPEAVQAAYTQATKTINKEISIPGFRKGKAPEALILQRFESQVQREWRDVLLNTAFHEFLTHTRFYPYTSTQKSIKQAQIKTLSKEEGASLHIEYEAAPTIPKVTFEHLKLKPVTLEETTSKEIEETLHQIQLKLGSWNKIEDRPVQEGDFVDVDIEALETPPRSICQNMRFEVASGHMGLWMRNLVIGKKAHETVEGMSELDPTSPESIENFQPTLCRITIQGIWTVELPPLDEKLAEQVGVKSIEELRVKIEADLKSRAVEERQNLLRAQVERFLLENYPFDVPASLIAHQLKEVVKHRLKEIQKHEHSKEQLAEITKELEVKVYQELVQGYRLYFLTRQLAEDNHIEVFEDEIRREMFKYLMSSGGKLKEGEESFSDELRSQLLVNVISRKVLDFLVEQANALEA